MRKIAYIASAILFILLLTTVSAFALEPDISQSQFDALNAGRVEEAVPDDASDMLNGIGIMDGLDYENVLSELMENAGGSIGSIIRKGVKSAALIVVIAVLSSMLTSLAEGTAPDSVRTYAPIAGIVAVSVVAVGDVGAFIGLGSAAVDDLNSFSKALLPTLSAAGAASGAFTSAAAKYAATALFFDVLISVARNVLMPIVYAYLAAVIANAAFGLDALSGIAKFLKWVATTILTVMMLGFVTYLTLSGIITGATDAVTTRIAKTAIGASLPVVGGIISDAASTILAGASILKNAIGVFGMLAILAICLLPFLKLAVHYICYKIAAGLTSCVSEQRLSNLVGGIGTAFGLVMGMTGACAIMIFLSVISMMKAVTPV